MWPDESKIGRETIPCCPAIASKSGKSGEDIEELAKIPAVVCANLVKNYRKCLTSVIISKDLCIKYSVLFWIKYILHSVKSKLLFFFLNHTMWFSKDDFYILILTVEV